MGLQDCQILLDNPWNTYYVGQTVNGQVKLQLNSPKKIRGIIIRFLGEANTRWNVTKKVHDEHGKERDEDEELTGHEEYFENHYYLLGSKNGNEITLPAGEHVYPFTCVLPPNLPSSFEGEFGHVRYTVKVVLDRPWKFDQETKMAFTVISHLDLNRDPDMKNPRTLDMEKNFCCLCCASGPLEAQVSIPCRGFVPGQSIPVTAEVNNHSNVKVDRLRVILRKRIEFRTQTPRVETRIDKAIINEFSIGPIDKNESKKLEQSIEIPPLPPTNMENCSIIKCDYELKVELNVSGAHADLDGVLPIVLGTIPLATTNQVPNTAPYTDVPQSAPAAIQDPSLAPTQPVSPASPGPIGAGWNLYPSIPAPTYTESDYRSNIVGKDESQYMRTAGGQNDFAPRYPVYTASALPPLPNTQT